MTNPIDRPDFNPHKANEPNPILMEEASAAAEAWRDRQREANDAKAIMNAAMIRLNDTGHSYKQIHEATGVPISTIQLVLSKPNT